MKLLAKIDSVEIVRQFPHADGTFGNVYGINMTVGDDQITADTFRPAESLKRHGIIPGAIGDAVLEFKVRRWTDKEGKTHPTQDIKLLRFELANKNISTEAANVSKQQGEKTAEQMLEEAEQEAELAKKDGTGMPF